MNIADAPVAAPVKEDTFELKQAESDLFKALCFNCDLRHNCSWKQHRKMYCEHFQ